MRNGKLAGYWGAPRTECDSAPRMIQHTIDWLSREWKDKIDFVIWTGDNARFLLIQQEIPARFPDQRSSIDMISTTKYQEPRRRSWL